MRTPSTGCRSSTTAAPPCSRIGSIEAKRSIGFCTFEAGTPSGIVSTGQMAQPFHGPAACCQRDQALRCIQLKAGFRQAPVERVAAAIRARAASACAMMHPAEASARRAPLARFSRQLASSAARTGWARAASTAAERRALASGQSRSSSATDSASRANRSTESRTTGSNASAAVGSNSCPRSSSPRPSGLAVPDQMRLAARRTAAAPALATKAARRPANAL